MKNIAPPPPREFRAPASATLVLLLLSFSVEVAMAESTWDPTAFVNTESFQTIDAGDGTTNIELQFGDTGNRKLLYNISTSRFQFTQPLFVGGDLTATGSLSVKKGISGATLRVDGNADIWGTLSATGVIKTKSNLTINADSDANDAVLTFGSDTTNETATWLNTADKFSFSDDVQVLGNLSGSTLNVDGNAGIYGALTVSGATTLKSTLKINNVTYTFPTSDGSATGKVLKTNSAGQLSWSTDLNTGGVSQTEADARYVNTSGDTMTGSLLIKNGGGLNASGSILTNTDINLNSDNGATDAVVTFGNQTAAQTLKYSHANQRFEFSKDVKVTGNVRASGNLSGSTLNVDGTINWYGQSYTGPTSQGASTYLKTDGAGNLTWSALPNGSGNILALRPAYQNAIYFASGSTAIGKLKGMQDTTNGRNYYRWTTTKTALNDYWTAVQIQIPKNFSHFEAASGMILRLRTSTTSSADNYITVRIKDTAENTVALTNNASLASTTANTWRTVTIGGVSTGTYTPGSDITIYIKTAGTSAGFTDLGSITLNWASTTP